MRAMAEVIDESVRNMTSNMVTKADQEKVSVKTLYLRNEKEKERCLWCLWFWERSISLLLVVEGIPFVTHCICTFFCDSESSFISLLRGED